MTASWIDPNIILEIAIEPKAASDAGRLVAELAHMTSSDSGFQYRVDPQSGALLVGGVSELDLDTKLGTLASRHTVEFLIGAPQVAYRETLARSVEVDYTHKKQTGGTGQFARVKLRLEPNELGKGNEFESEIIGGVAPKEYLPCVEKGIRSIWGSGMLIGFPMVDMKVTLCDGAYHELDSSAIAFEIAARQCMQEGCRTAGVKLLEPIMDVEVVTPGDFVGTVIGDVHNRRGQIHTQDVRGNATVVRAYVPLANMFGYQSQLLSNTRGAGHFTQQFSHYETVPPRRDGPDNFPPAVGVRA